MTSNKIREKFLDFFRMKGHEIVPSAPMVVKNDPTLMFINSGMAPFKDLFLGNAPVKYKRIADTQKCLRVSGKHNDLEEVGVDTYHHTMFEMLGNWSFGDYFKKEAIEWSWELLVGVYKIDPDRLYVTVFEGSAEDKLAFDQEAADNWKRFVSLDRILNGNKKDNFWEMGDTGPCGPCSEIHVDLRDDKERKKADGRSLVNTGHPQVIEIWNNVFMEFNRKADGSLEKLPAQHVDTGMGFERLCMVLQHKRSSYDTDVFQPIIQKMEDISGLRYSEGDHHGKGNEVINIAMRVISDHIRAISFSIADGQLPSNTGAGYVIRRILRRAIRYGYQSLNLKEPFMHRLVPVLAHQMGVAFPELNAQKLLIEKVIKEEETSFYRTLETGLKKIDAVCIDLSNQHKKAVDGKVVFELYDTFGFPDDLTSLIARGYGLSIDEKGFREELEKQKNRSREASVVDTDDWVNVSETHDSIKFTGYDHLTDTSRVVRYRKVKAKGKEQVQLVLDRTPFYAESGGQVGDTGVLEYGSEQVLITDTKKENGVIVHYTTKVPQNISASFTSKVDEIKRHLTEDNHSATHLLHAALRKVLGTHVEQKGSLVNEEHLRFDFSHFAKITEEDLLKIESMVNEKIRENIPADIKEMPIVEARKLGAMALFGEKYGDVVRVVTFDKNYSIELCGGTHVKATGQIGFFKIISESAIAAGIRRIEAITSVKAEQFFTEQLSTLQKVKELLKNPKDISKSIQGLLEENAALNKQVESLFREKARSIKAELKAKGRPHNSINFICERITIDSADAIKDIAFELKQTENTFLVLGAEVKGKPSITVAISDDLVSSKKLNAGNIVRELAKEIQGGGGGQPNYANAGGSNLQGIDKALEKAITFIS
jgi:alanyl-tRNA synthetase